MDERERIEAERAEVIRVHQLRWKFLLELYRHYKEVPAGELQSVPADEIGGRIGLTDRRQFEQVWSYLKDAGLLRVTTHGPSLSITKAGIDEAEEAYREPDKPTMHLPPLNVVYNVTHGGIHGSTVQQGTTHSTQAVDQSRGIDWEGLRAILREIRAVAVDLPSDQRQEILAEVATLEAQSESPRPKIGIVQVCLTSLRALLANTAGNVAAAPLINWLNAHDWLLR